MDFFLWMALLVDFVTNDSCLLNPVSMEKIGLPPLNTRYIKDHVRCILTKPPTDADCCILFISDIMMPILICRPGGEKFVEQSSNFGNEYLRTATSFKGKIYGLMSPSNNLVIVEILGSMIIQVQKLINGGGIPFRVFPSPRKGRCTVYLIESSGELLYVQKNYSASFINQISDFRIFRVDTCRMTSEELISLGEATIFLNTSSGMSCSTTLMDSKVKKNCIYFVNKSDKNLSVYDFEDRSRTMLTPCPIVERLNSGQCCVLMP